LRTLLIFAYECSPYHHRGSVIAGQRPAQFARHLPHFGWRSIVVCCDGQARGTGAWSGTARCALAERVRRALHASSATGSAIVPTPSLAYDGLLDRAWRTLRPRGHGLDPVRGVLRKPLTIAKLATGDESQAWQPCARVAADVIAREIRIDACLGEHSPDAGLFLARWFADRYRVPWVADFRDSALHAIAPLLRRPYTWFLRRLLSTASYTVNVTPYWAELDAQLFRRPSVTITNGFDPTEFTRGHTRLSASHFTVVFAGNLWREMRPEVFFDGLALLRTRIGSGAFSRIRVVARGGGSARLKTCAARVGVADVVDAGAQIPREDLLLLVQGADLLLLFSIAGVDERDIVLRRGMYPGKVFEYLGARRPIVCVPGDGALLDDLLRRTGAGVVLATPAAVAEYLGSALAAWNDGRRTEYKPDERALGQYARRSLTGELAEILDRAVAAPMSAPSGAHVGAGAGIVGH
jgi:glycosyltransferase involved in cell wall biosynthesis